MAQPSLDDLKAQFDQQNDALTELATAMAGVTSVDVPPSFFAELDEACAVRPTMPAIPVELHFAMRG